MPSSQDSKAVRIPEPDIRKRSKRAVANPEGREGSSGTMGDILWVFFPILAQPCLQTHPALELPPVDSGPAAKGQLRNAQYLGR